MRVWVPRSARDLNLSIRDSKAEILNLAGNKPTNSEIYKESRRHVGKRVRTRAKEFVAKKKREEKHSAQAAKRKRRAKDPDRAARKRVMGKS
jgi:hypothetical protein